MSTDQQLSWLGLISTACFTVSYLPQLARTYRTRNVQGLSTAYWIIVVAGYVTGCVYVGPLQDRWLHLTYGIGLLCAVAMLTGCLLFRAR